MMLIKYFSFSDKKNAPTRFQYGNFAHGPPLTTKLVPRIFNDSVFYVSKCHFYCRIDILSVILVNCDLCRSD